MKITDNYFIEQIQSKLFIPFQLFLVFVVVVVVVGIIVVQFLVLTTVSPINTHIVCRQELLWVC